MGSCLAVPSQTEVPKSPSTRNETAAAAAGAAAAGAPSTSSPDAKAMGNTSERPGSSMLNVVTGNLQGKKKSAAALQTPAAAGAATTSAAASSTRAASSAAGGTTTPPPSTSASTGTLGGSKSTGAKTGAASRPSSASNSPTRKSDAHPLPDRQHTPPSPSQHHHHLPHLSSMSNFIGRKSGLGSPVTPPAAAKHEKAVPANPKLEALQTDKQVARQIQEINAHNPRKTIVGQSVVSARTAENTEFTLTYAYVSQTGYYPENLSKANQDSVTVQSPFALGGGDAPSGPTSHLFAVFDGHGAHGDSCAVFARDNVPVNLAQCEMYKRGDYERAFHDAYVQTNFDMHQQQRYGKFNDTLSGTTAISGLLHGRRLYVANVGDSRAIMGVRSPDGKLRAEPLSIDQTPFREDERERVKRAGARVLTMDQIEGYADVNSQTFGTEDEDDGDPPRLWSQDGAYPGTAFTRSLGDLVAEHIGVIPEPELLSRELTAEDEFFLLASDGIFEFLSSQAVADIVAHYDDALEACRALVSEAYRLWLQYEVRTDDISVILVRIKGLAPAATMDPKAKLERTRSAIKEVVKQGEVRPVRRNLSRVKMGTVGQMHIDPKEFEGFELPVHAKSADECARIKAAVRANFLFRHLNEEQLDKAVMAMETYPVKAKDVIIRQFDEGDRFYIADYGEYDVEVSVPSTVPNPSDPDSPVVVEGKFEPPRRVFTYDSKHGNNPCFGELALMYSKPRAATVLAKTDGRLWALERKAFRSILMKTPTKHIVQLLRRVEVLKPLSRVDLQRMADLLTEVTFAPGAYIVRQGEPGDTFYIVTEGKADVTKVDHEGAPPSKVMELSEYMYFGERALLHDAPRAASVIAVGKVKCLSIHRRDFEEVLGHMEDRIKSDRELRERKSRKNLLDQDTQVADERDEMGELVKSIGDLPGGGPLACVGQAVHVGPSVLRVVAPLPQVGRNGTLKVSSKRGLVAKKELALALNELRALRELKVKSAFVPTLLVALSAPRGQDALYQLFGTSIVTDLSRFLSPGKPLGMDVVQYTLRCLAAALDVLHSVSVVFRGLVPEAVGLTEEGVPQLLDFRFAKTLSDEHQARTFTICGTPEYMSPEQVAGIGHAYEADIWSLGVLAFECIAGTTPWGTEGKNEIAVYSSISAFGESSLKFPANVPAEAESFIRAVMKPEMEDRLVTTTEVIAHPFLKRVDVSTKASVSPLGQACRVLFDQIAMGGKLTAKELEDGLTSGGSAAPLDATTDEKIRREWHV